MRFVTGYHHLIEAILKASGQSDKFVHVQIGLVIWLFAALMSRRSLTSPVPLLTIIALESANEIMDRLYAGSWNWPDTIGDAVSTWAWPCILALSMVLDRNLRGGGTDARIRTDDAPGDSQDGQTDPVK